MSKKRNAALDALTGAKAVAADVVPIRAEPEAAPRKAERKVAKVMLYLPPRVKRKFDEMAFHEDRKAHDYYLLAIEQFLREKGHGKEADLLVR